LEEAGIPTASIFIKAFEHVARAMSLPRVVITHSLLGRTVAPPGAAETQRNVVTTALRLLEATDQTPILVEMRSENPFSSWSSPSSS